MMAKSRFIKRAFSVFISLMSKPSLFKTGLYTGNYIILFRFRTYSESHRIYTIMEIQIMTSFYQY